MGIAKFTLGTAQLGLNYGIANSAGMPDESRAVAIVHRALDAGVQSLDTARAYGDAEEKIGRALAERHYGHLRIVTKLDPLRSLDPGASEFEVRAAVDQSVFRSCDALDRRPLQTLLLHNWANRFSFGEAIWRRLLELKSEGHIEVLGASVYTPAEAETALKDPAIGHLQIPFNVLDWRWKAAGIDALARQRADVCVHARSALLQGLLSADEDVWAKLDGSRPDLYLNRLQQLTDTFGRESRADFCFAYAAAQDWIDSIVVGVETPAQLDTNLQLFKKPSLSAEACAAAERLLAEAPETLLNPSQWKISA